MTDAVDTVSLSNTILMASSNVKRFDCRELRNLVVEYAQDN
jgi:hypothetical protein